MFGLSASEKANYINVYMSLLLFMGNSATLGMKGVVLMSRALPRRRANAGDVR